MTSNLPATQTDAPLAPSPSPPPAASVPVERPEVRQSIGVALLPMALVTFVIIGLVIAAWTFLGAG